MPFFLQWCFDGVSEITERQDRLAGEGEQDAVRFHTRARSVLGRLWQLLIGMEMVVDDEIERLHRARQVHAEEMGLAGGDEKLQQIMRRNEGPVLSITVDILASILPEVVSTLGVHARRSRNRQGDCKRLTDLWISLLHKKITELEKIFGSTDLQIGTWHQSLRQARMLQR